MCGIAGLFCRDGLPEESQAALARMQAAMAHRGPDGKGHFAGTHAALGMQRLSIIDLEGGWQPLYNEDESLVLVANGEIYNFVELRQTLEAAGHRFRTRSDCETILHLYEEHGEDCVHHLRGMFAFALWDGGKERLLLARDRVGEKPLYMVEQEGRLVFASELKALLASGLVPRDLDPCALDRYLHYQYVPEPATPLEHVRKLPPACQVSVRRHPWSVTQKRYWALTEAAPVDGDPVERIRTELDRIGRLILRSDVPVGLALSGGLDSSAVACFAARHADSPLQTLTVGYPGRPAFDERQDAQALAAHLGLPFKEIELPLGSFVRDFPDLVEAMDEPVADIAAYAHMAVMRFARERDLKVMLCGLGGDELFWGYPWLSQAIALTEEKDRLAETPRWWSQSRGLASLLQHPRCFRYAHHRRLPAPIRSAFHYLWEKGLVMGGHPLEAVAQDLKPAFHHARLLTSRLYTPDFAARIAARNAYGPLERSRPECGHVPLALCRILFDTWLAGNCLSLGDRLSMAWSVEMRLPLLDAQLVETVMGLRKRHADHEQGPKHWLREALKGMVPETILERPKKGFRPPVDEWMRGVIGQYGGQLAEGSLVGLDVLDADGVGKALAEWRERGAYAFMLYKLVLLELWHRRVVLGETIAA